MEKNISLFDLLNLSIGSPHKSSVNFGALHALLLEMLKLLDLREATTLFKFSPPGDRVPDAPLGAPVKVPTHPSVSDQLVPPGSDLQKLTESVSVLDGTGGDDFRTSGDGVSQALNLIEELQKNRDDMKQKTEHLQFKASNIIEDLQRNSANLREKAEELQNKALKVIEQLQGSKDLKKTDHGQHKATAEEMEIQVGLENCCQRLDVLDKAVESIQELFQMYPDPEELNQCVTWVQLVQRDMEVEKGLETSEVLDWPGLIEQTGPEPSALSSAAPALTSGTSAPASGVPVSSPGASAPSSHPAAPFSGASAASSGTTAPSSGTTVLSTSVSAPPSGSSSPSSGVSVPLSGGPLHPESSPLSAAPPFPSISAEDRSLEAAADSTQASSDGSEGGTIAGGQGSATEPQPVTSSVLSGSTPETVPQLGAQPEIQPGAQPGIQPGAQTGIHPGAQPGSQPGAQPGIHPGAQPGSQPGAQPGIHPGAQPGSQPGAQPGIHPGAQPGAQTGIQPGAQPGIHPGAQPGSQPGAQPGIHPGAQPGAQTGIQPGAQPGIHPGAQPGSQPGAQPGIQPGAQPGSQPGAQPGSQPGAQPGAQTGIQPGAQTGIQPGAQTGIQPGAHPGIQTGTHPGAHPGAHPGTHPGAQPGAHPGTHPGAHPGAQPGTHPGAQPGAHPGTHPGAQPGIQTGTHPGAQPGTHPGAQPGIHPGAQPGAQPARVTSSVTPVPSAGIRGDLKRPSETPAVRHQCLQMEEFLKNIRKLQERVAQLEAHTRILEEKKVDWTGLAQFISSRDSPEVPGSTAGQVENLKTEDKMPEHLEDVSGNLVSREMGSSAVSVAAAAAAAAAAAHRPDPRIKDLTQQVSDLRSSLVQVEQEVELLKEKQAQSEERAAEHLQDQLNDLRGTLEDTIVSLTSQLSSSLQQEVEQEMEKTEEAEEAGEEEEEEEEEAFSSSVEVGRKLSLLFQNYEQLEDTVNLLVQQQQQGAARDGLDEDRDMGRSLDLVYDVQRAIQELQAECERLQEATRSLHEDNQQKQGHIEELYKTAEELQVKKADKLMVESEIKADKLALDSKVSRLQFDAATEQLTSMFHELLNKMTGQEHDWHQLVEKLSTDMELKLNRMELDSVKLQLEERWRSILKKLQTQSAPLEDDAAGIRKKLLERFHCLSCDRVIMKQTPGPIVPTLPTFPPFPLPKSARPWTMEQIRQHYRSLTPGTSQRRVQLQKNHADMLRQLNSIERQRRLRQRPNQVAESPARPAGVSHTSTSASQRRSGPQHHRLSIRAEDLMQEADIIGRDGRIYKGRFSIGQLKSPETKLPNIVSRDGKLKGRTRSIPKAPAASPEAELSPLATPPSLSTKSLQPSRPASSGSSPDWAVSPLGSVSPLSAAESEPLGL